ncbi:MAG: heparinase, partial [Erythrobacter sp.]|nr:heparinase [Erythrobacter sp.]
MASLFSKDPLEAEFEELPLDMPPAPDAPGERDNAKSAAKRAGDGEAAAIGLGPEGEAHADTAPGDEAIDPGDDDAPIPADRALALTDVIAPRARAGEAMIRLAYRLGVPGHVLAAPFRRASPIRVLATVESPITGDRAAGMALRAGHFLVHGVKQPIGQLEFENSVRLSPGLERTVHGFTWLDDLAASAPREDCIGIAERITSLWLDANPKSPRGAGKGPAWCVENVGLRVLAWLVHAPLVLAGRDGALKPRLLDAIGESVHWLDKQTPRSGAGLGEVAGWAAVTAA